MKGICAGRSLEAAALLVLLGAAGCDQLLVEPGSAPTAAVALTLAPSGPNFAVAPASANRIRVQVRDDGTVLLDSVFSFDPEQEEMLVPVRFSSSETTVSLLVEIAEDALPLLRGSAELRLRQRRVTDAEVRLSGASVFPLEPVGELTAGIYHSCATAGEGGLFCWGNNEEGQLGTGKFRPSPMPESIEGSGGFYGISAGFLSTCGLAFEGSAFCWGDNEHGSLGVGGSVDRSAVPRPVATAESFRMLTVNGLHACGLNFEGQAFCWGFNGFGQLGDGTTTTRFTPVPAAPQLRFTSISAGYVHTCGITTGGQGYCWGLNEFGQLGNGSTSDASSPALVGGAEIYTEISAGGLHTCALNRIGEAFCWGFNRSGQLGDGSTDDRGVPARIGTTRFSGISAGGLHSCGVDVDGDALCWGYNGSGALGDDTLDDRLTPVPVTGGLSFRIVRAGLHHSCGIVTSGRVVCWGYNRFGQLGDGSRFDRSEPGDVLYGERFFEEEADDSNEVNEAVAALLKGRLIPARPRS